ncbi:MAG: hypothetical protein HYV14_08340 [Elusimicrobia bacterium]|nr:hypothetical protein [Elusimicrobiota bacterium]
MTADLEAEQAATLASPRRAYGLLARVLFLGMDLVYGKRRTLRKFTVLEVIARVPYQAWEQVAYVAMTHTYRTPGFARRVFEFVKESRAQQDNEQWHLLILEELIQKEGLPESFLLYRLAPQLVALFYYHVSWVLYAVDPKLSYALNADFEDHAEHEYMEFVRENPALAGRPFDSEFKADYGEHLATLADLFRQIGLDERRHKDESLARIAAPRFS